MRRLWWDRQASSSSATSQPYWSRYLRVCSRTFSALRSSARRVERDRPRRFASSSAKARRCSGIETPTFIVFPIVTMMEYHGIPGLVCPGLFRLRPRPATVATCLLLYAQNLPLSSRAVKKNVDGAAAAVPPAGGCEGGDVPAHLPRGPPPRGVGLENGGLTRRVLATAVNDTDARVALCDGTTQERLHLLGGFGRVHSVQIQGRLDGELAPPEPAEHESPSSGCRPLPTFPRGENVPA